MVSSSCSKSKSSSSKTPSSKVLSLDLQEFLLDREYPERLDLRAVAALRKEGLLQPVQAWARRRCKKLFERFIDSDESDPLLVIAAKERWRESAALVRFIEGGAERIDDE